MKNRISKIMRTMLIQAKKAAKTHEENMRLNTEHITKDSRFWNEVNVLTKKAYLFFLAIEPSCRLKGYGSRTIETLKAEYPEKNIVKQRGIVHNEQKI